MCRLVWHVPNDDTIRDASYVGYGLLYLRVWVSEDAKREREREGEREREKEKMRERERERERKKRNERERDGGKPVESRYSRELRG